MTDLGDETPKILAEYAERYPFIKVITRADRGDRKLGGGVIDAFYTGYDTLNPADYDYVCKLDLDLDLPQNYFTSLMKRMEENPRIGTASGKPFFVQDGKIISEMCGDENSVGHGEVLSHGMLSADRRLCSRADVGRDRLPPLQTAWLDRRQLAGSEPAVRTPSSHGNEP